jgi:YVTN family beta-propeller protein
LRQFGSDNVTVIDGATNQVIATIQVGDGPWALVWNSTNNKVYCANWGSDNVSVIDGATNQVIATIQVGRYPCALVWNSTNNKVYCANWEVTMFR